jgi:hypothetical protein
MYISRWQAPVPMPALRDTERARILDERDAARLDRWLARAVTCMTADELFAEPGESG